MDDLVAVEHQELDQLSRDLMAIGQKLNPPPADVLPVPFSASGLPGSLPLSAAVDRATIGLKSWMMDLGSATVFKGQVTAQLNRELPAVQQPTVTKLQSLMDEATRATPTLPPRPVRDPLPPETVPLTQVLPGTAGK